MTAVLDALLLALAGLLLAAGFVGFSVGWDQVWA